jgi:hypothetical protein
MSTDSMSPATPWLNVREAAARAKCGERSIYLAVAARKLRAARLAGHRELRFLPEFIDAWLLATTTPVLINPHPGDTQNDSLAESRALLPGTRSRV